MTAAAVAPTTVLSTAPAITLDRRDTRARPDAAAFDALRAALAARLARACADLPAAELQTLVRDTTRTRLRWERRRRRRVADGAEAGATRYRGAQARRASA